MYKKYSVPALRERMVELEDHLTELLEDSTSDVRDIRAVEEELIDVEYWYMEKADPPFDFSY